jgi:hypothetical protein
VSPRAEAGREQPYFPSSAAARDRLNRRIGDPVGPAMAAERRAPGARQTRQCKPGEPDRARMGIVVKISSGLIMKSGARRFARSVILYLAARQFVLDYQSRLVRS